jgi:hypothetical protein
MRKLEGKGVGDIEGGQPRGWQRINSVNKIALSKIITNLISFFTGG